MAGNMRELGRIAEEKDLEKLGGLSLAELEVVFYRLNLLADRERRREGFLEFYEAVYEMKSYKQSLA
jgi:hypothetical protein